MKTDPYKILGIPYNASLEDIKSNYRLLVKKYHPDLGGSEEKILEINAAWEMLKNEKNRNLYIQKKTKEEIISPNIKMPKSNGVEQDKSIDLWLKSVYLPIDKLIGEILNSFPNQLKELSADPYDETLMESFCKYIQTSQKKIQQVHNIYQSIPTPLEARNFSLSLYHCFSEIQDGINEWERYTAGYVENYLHDGKEMLRGATKQRLILQEEKQNFSYFENWI